MLPAKEKPRKGFVADDFIPTTNYTKFQPENIHKDTHTQRDGLSTTLISHTTAPTDRIKTTEDKNVTLLWGRIKVKFIKIPFAYLITEMVIFQSTLSLIKFKY